MSIFEDLKMKNGHVRLFHVQDRWFRQYGRIVHDIDVEDLVQRTIHFTGIPEEGNVYIHSSELLENEVAKSLIERRIYGGCPIQIGYCNGTNSHLNGLEYHKGHEVNIACTDLVLFLGKVQDIANNSYHTSLIEAFYLPKGTCVELFSTTLHFAPCKTNSDGFQCIVILPKGTNTPLLDERARKDDVLLFMKNKWLLVHPENERLVARGAYPGLKGENVKIHIV